MEKVIGCSDQRRGCDGLLWMSWISRLSLLYLLLLELDFRPHGHVDRPLGLLEWAVGVAYLRRRWQVALVVAVFWLLIITSTEITAIVFSAATSVVMAVVVVAT
jgi:hypothetical protein